MTASDFDKLQEELQEEVLADIREIYSEQVIEHAMNPRNVGEIDNADGYGSAFGHCGDCIEIWLRVKNDKIELAQFWTDGCAATIASGSATAEMITSMPIAQARGITQQDILTTLGGLPSDHEHCATLATNALKEAIKDYFALKREPWKKGYKQR